ncbi:hypothetical protein F5148DRAFT_316263 [Russula earlei]|uniref:Uncharacterized protein n=1 Tax=Russula earlei TaxID=71964 RepID=A0ACC0U4E2_9AGAM|nr:hypothetical protein F5148DRAFT_316263 [Russula earlei]
MSTATDPPRKDVKYAVPIPILPPPHRRRPSISSSDGSPTSPVTLQTPNSLYPTNLAPSSPTNSSFLSYFMSTSPKSSVSFPYRRPPGLGAPPVFEDDDGQEFNSGNSIHQRRATTAWVGNSRNPPQRVAPAPPVIEAQHARGAGVLRRLSLGGGLNGSLFQNAANRPASPPRPTTPPPSAVTPSAASGFPATQNNADVRTRVRRSATLTVPSRNATHRAPSPMGERILKGHFDGFN